MEVKKVIKQKGFTLVEVAKMLGITRVTLSQNLERTPTYRTLQKIANDFFLDETTEKPVSTYMIEYEGKCHAFHELSEAVDFICGIVNTKKEPPKD